jgi:hypothetical protein
MAMLQENNLDEDVKMEPEAKQTTPSTEDDDSKNGELKVVAATILDPE